MISSHINYEIYREISKKLELKDIDVVTKKVLLKDEFVNVGNFNGIKIILNTTLQKEYEIRGYEIYNLYQKYSRHFNETLDIKYKFLTERLQD